MLVGGGMQPIDLNTSSELEMEGMKDYEVENAKMQFILEHGKQIQK